MTGPDVAILGGGLAGLVAARRLYRAGVDVQVFEARDRLGGRILTVDADGLPAARGIDLGPSWVWPATQPAVAALLEELGLATAPQRGTGDALFDLCPDAPPTRRSAVQVDPTTRRIVGGTGALVAALARDVPACRVHLTAPVRRLSRGQDGVRLALPGGPVRAQRVLAALPPRLLAGTVDFDPALPRDTHTAWQATPTWMAPHAKFVAIYDRPFWHAAGLSGMVQSMVGPLAEIHDASADGGPAALFGFVGIAAAARAQMGDAALRAACLAQLGRLFGPEAAAPRTTWVKDWATDPLTATVDDPRAAGHPSAPPGIAGPWADALILAGSEASPRDAGYLSGAIESAMLATAAVLADRAA